MHHNIYRQPKYIEYTTCLIIDFIDFSSESSTSSSDESDEEDGASIDSRDFGFFKQDLNVCPKGCEQAIYDLTVNLRSKRLSCFS